MQPIVVIAAQLAILNSVANDVIGDHQNAMSHRHAGFLHPAATGDPHEQRGKEAVLGMPDGPAVLDQTTAKITVALARGAAAPFAGALIIART